MKRKHRNNKGFSIAELLVTIGIVSVLLGISVTGYNQYLVKFSVDQAAEEALISLRTAQQKAITLGLKSGIYIHSKTEYWVFADPMSGANLIPYKNLLATLYMPPKGSSPAIPEYLPMEPPSNILWKVKLNNAWIEWPDVGCAVYSTPETKPEQNKSWYAASVYIYPSLLEDEDQKVLTFAGGNGSLGIKQASVWVDADSKFYIRKE